MRIPVIITGFAAAIAIIFAVLWWIEAQVSNDLETQLAVTRAELDAERARSGELTDRILRADGEIEELREDLDAVGAGLNEEQQKNVALNGQIDAARLSISSLESDLSNIRQDLSDDRQQIGALLAQADETDRRLSSTQAELVSVSNQNVQQQATLSELRDELTSTHSALDNAQIANGNLSSGLTASCSENTMLIARLDSLLLPAPVSSEPMEVSGTLTNRNLVSIPISVNAQQEIRGEIDCGRIPCEPYIQTPMAGQCVPLAA